jgi:hypothetical protein
LVLLAFLRPRRRRWLLLLHQNPWLAAKCPPKFHLPDHCERLLVKPHKGLLASPFRLTLVAVGLGLTLVNKHGKSDCRFQICKVI